MIEQVEAVYRDAEKALGEAADGAALKAWEQHYLGKKGVIIELVRSVGVLPKEDRAAFGKRANEIKNALEAAYAEREAVIAQEEMARALREGALDVTLPARPRSRGAACTRPRIRCASSTASGATSAFRCSAAAMSRTTTPTSRC